jgi:hypothetical protein
METDVYLGVYDVFNIKKMITDFYLGVCEVFNVIKYDNMLSDIIMLSDNMLSDNTNLSSDNYDDLETSKQKRKQTF